jgi:hypothetical protein
MGLAGLQATVQQQAIVPVVAVIPAGQQATVTQGTLLGGSAGELTTQVATAAVGTLTPTVAVVLTGLSATASVGSFVPALAIPVTTLAATVSGGTLKPALAVTLTGLAATVVQGTQGTDRRYANPIIWTAGSYWALTRYNDSTDSKNRIVYGTVVGPYLGYAAYDTSTRGWRREGKWYVEFKENYGAGDWYAGLGDFYRTSSNGFHLGKTTAGGVDLYGWSAGLLATTFTTATNGTETTQLTRNFAANDIVMMAVDLDTGKLWFGLNGTWLNSGNPATGANPTYTGVQGGGTRGVTPMASLGTPGGATLQGVFIRAALDAMTYGIPSGFQPWETSDLITSKALTTQVATISQGTIGAFHGVGVLTTQTATVQQGTLAPSIQITGVPVGQQAKIWQGVFPVITAGANVSVHLYGLAATVSSGSLAATHKVGATGAQAIAPTIEQASYSGAGGDYFPQGGTAANGWATNTIWPSYDGVIQGAGDEGYLDTSLNTAPQRRFGYAFDQSTRGKTWGYMPWTTSQWNSPGDINSFNPFYSGGGDHYAGGEVYDFYGTNQAPGGTFSVDLDGNMHFAHTRGYGLYAGRAYTTPDLVYYLQVSDKSQKVWRRNSFAVDSLHELLMGVYGHTPTRSLVFYPVLSGSDWIPAVRVWDGTDLSSETQIGSFTGNGSCNAVHKHLCVTRAGYGDTIYVSYYSNTGHIGLIVMDAVTLSVTSHVLTATVATGTTWTTPGLSNNLASSFPEKSQGEVFYRENGDSVTQFLMNKQFVRLKWTSGTATTPTQTLKTGPSTTALGGWESLEYKGDEVYHVVYERTVVSSNYNNGTGRYDYVQDFKIYYNDVTGTGSTWTASSVLWSWTQSLTLNQVSDGFTIWFSGSGDGKQAVLYSVPCLFIGKGYAEAQAKLAWMDMWGGQQQYMSVAAKGRVGRITVTIVPGVVLTGQTLTASGGALAPSVTVALTGLAATVGQGTIVGAIPVDATVGLTGLQATVQQQAIVITRGASLAGQTLTASVGTLAPTGHQFASLIGQKLTTSSGSMGQALAVTLAGAQLAVQQGLLTKEIAARLTGQSLTTGTGVFVPALNLRLVGVQLQSGVGVFAPLTAVNLVGIQLAALDGSLQLALAVPLTGQSAVGQQGQLGLLYDCNVFATGVYALGVVGTEPTTTNVPAIGKDDLLWARAAVDKLFTQVSPDELFNDVEPRE